MKQHLLKNTYAAIVALFIAMFALPTTAQAQTEYDLWICGTQVTSDNCGDLSGINGVEGTVKYDPDSKTLTLEGAKLNIEGEVDCIKSKIDGLTIKVGGTNELNAGSSVYAPTTITGGGTLNAESEGYAAIYAEGTNLTIKDCIVNAKGRWGIAGDDGSKETLRISNATVTAEGRAGSICDFKEITLEDCAITQPAGAVVDNSQGAVVLNGEKVTSEVKIVQTKYALKICGTQVTSGNCGDLSVIDGVKGTVSYDPDSKTLTLEGAKLNVEGNDNCINSEIDGLTIKVSGTNELNAGETAIIVYAPTTLTGGGMLNAKSEKYTAIYAYETDLTIKDCIVNAKGNYGIAGNNGSNEKLLISNATVRAEGEAGSICDFKEITLEDCAITQPAGAVVDNSQGAVVLNGEIVKSKIVITRDPAGINTPTIDTAAKQGIYTLSGVKLDGEMKDLPKGVYIVNGKKVVK
ncbi:peptidase [Alloprevotella tannerae]|uniref:peptidase n=1 Tax=Alloprevotella tannerae TaxID=76122 RepID=UPI00288B68B7|nr:peptidase [Alloprevotella tannerae]